MNRFIIILLILNFNSSLVFSQGWNVPEEFKLRKNPTELNAENILKGKALYNLHCQTCHGDPGYNNPKEMEPAPPDPTSKDFQKNNDGEMNFIIREGSQDMTQFKNTLSDNEIWQVIDYLRFFNPEYPKVGDTSILYSQFEGRELHLELEMDEAARTLTVAAKAINKEDQIVGYPNIPISVGIKRYFGIMYIQKGILTNDSGYALIKFPENLAGDLEGKLDVVVKIDNPDFYGDIKETFTGLFGTPVTPPDIFSVRSLWAENSNTSLWIIYSYFFIVISVWATIFYVIFLIVKIHKKGKVFFALFFFIFIPSLIFGEDGKTLYNKKCKSCHTIGGGDLKGPDLKGSTANHSSKWIKDFILSSKQMIQAGDKDAIAIFEKFKKKSMPDFNLSDKQLDALVAYISEQSGGTASDDSSKKSSFTGNADIGRKYFEGNFGFINKGVSCIACHEVNNNLEIPGGLLGPNLTYSFKNSGGYAGLKGNLESPPFPSMSIAYEKNPLTEEEMGHLIAFLESASKDAKTEAIEKSFLFQLSGLAGSVLILFITAIVWNNRKKYSVNRKIIERQKRITTQQ